ncbi:hypothetical protein AK812_SmicGene11684 [Symbiodinium microadriaticum]|uniref:Uncharacterized protein n=1 Tax=Symbiodinium microadriaticum TaxID=2951 RepID=A0A1Q9ECI6_SYMMI|nr:hypothetical protein AK812_SmicGene11684 [Symbiodinium microadriaticum]
MCPNPRHGKKKIATAVRDLVALRGQVSVLHAPGTSLSSKSEGRAHAHGRGRGGHGHHIFQPKYRRVEAKEEQPKIEVLELADEAFAGIKDPEPRGIKRKASTAPVPTARLIDERSIDLKDFVYKDLEQRTLEPDDAQHYLQGIFSHLLKDSAVVMVPEASLSELSLQEDSLEHLTYRLMKTPCNRIEWQVDLMGSHHLCITEVEELALGSDIIWSTRRKGHELNEREAQRVMETMRRLVPVASKVSHDPEDEYLTELFQEDACYFEEHGCYPPDY